MPITPRRTALPQPTDRVALGASGLLVSPLCIGMVQDARVIPAAFEQGVNFFFVSADMHWPLYESIRRGLADVLSQPGRREQIVVGGVSYVARPEFVHLPFDELVESIPGLGHLDLTIMGGCSERNFIELRAQFELHKKKQVRAIGASFHDRRTAQFVLQHRAVDIAYVRYNAMHPGAEQEVFPAVELEKPGRPALFNFKSTSGYLSPQRLLALGLKEKNWQPKRSDHYRFVLAQPALSGLLCSPQTLPQLDELVAQLRAGPLSLKQEGYIRLISQLARGEVALDEDPPPPQA